MLYILGLVNHYMVAAKPYSKFITISITLIVILFTVLLVFSLNMEKGGCRDI